MKNQIRILRSIGHERDWYYLNELKSNEFTTSIKVCLKLLFKCAVITGNTVFQLPNRQICVKLDSHSHERLFSLQRGAIQKQVLEVRGQNVRLQGFEKLPKKILTLWEFCILTYAIVAILIYKNKRRRVLEFYWIFYKIINQKIRMSSGIPKVLITYNDQDFITAAILNALQELGTYCIVIQHGLILNPSAYFPCNSDEFWAWGSSSKTQFSAVKSGCRYRLVGRLQKDYDLYHAPKLFRDCDRRLLIAVGSRWRDIKLALEEFKFYKIQKHLDLNTVNIKFHPGTKFLFFIKLYFKIFYPEIKFENRWIENIVSEYDILYTRNSTAILDFLLAGNFVLLQEERQVLGDLLEYCIILKDLELYNYDVDEASLELFKSVRSTLDKYLTLENRK